MRPAGQQADAARAAALPAVPAGGIACLRWAARGRGARKDRVGHVSARPPRDGGGGATTAAQIRPRGTRTHARRRGASRELSSEPAEHLHGAADPRHAPRSVHARPEDVAGPSPPDWLRGSRAGDSSTERGGRGWGCAPRDRGFCGPPKPETAISWPVTPGAPRSDVACPGDSAPPVPPGDSSTNLPAQDTTRSSASPAWRGGRSGAGRPSPDPARGTAIPSPPDRRCAH